jgi:hypothetical protein
MKLNRSLTELIGMVTPVFCAASTPLV